MHSLQPKQIKLKQNEVKELLAKFNISINQLPKIIKADPSLPQDCKAGDVIRIERKSGDGKTLYYRVVV
jgi:DNA-directed RNA polymerase subunit H (RpoH/RPB5)